MVNEIVATRIERAQAGLAQSVQASDGAHFRMLLSLISSNESFGYQGRAQEAAQGEFAAQFESQALSTYIPPDQLYNADTVARINEGLHRGQRGEMAYALAWVDTQANIPRSRFRPLALPDPQTTLSMIA